MSDDNEKEPLQNNFFVRVGFVVICLIVLYYIFSPYQNCVRTWNAAVCTSPKYKTSW